MKILVPALLLALLVATQFQTFIPIAICLTLAVAFAAVSSVAAARALTGLLR